MLTHTNLRFPHTFLYWILEFGQSFKILQSKIIQLINKNIKQKINRIVKIKKNMNTCIQERYTKTVLPIPI